MGQCMSRKAAGAFAASAAATHQRPTKMPKHKHLSPDDENNKDNNPKRISPIPSSLSQNQNLKGVAISFGFKRRSTTTPSIASNPSAARRLANNIENNVDKNGNGESDTDPLTSNAVPTGRTTPRLMPPKKEAVASRVNRFGFRQPQINRINKVADLNMHQTNIEICNNNLVKPKINQEPVTNKVNTVMVDNNKNKRFGFQPLQAEKYTLQSSQLPKPTSAKVVETKTAKTLFNTSRKNAKYQHDDNWSKDGSLTEDSGVGSGGAADIEHLNSSPTYGVRRDSIKVRNLEMVVNGNTFDVRDLDETAYNSSPLPQLPQLPSAFASANEKYERGYLNNGFVRERTLEYQRHLDTYNQRKISITSSEGFSDDYGENEKTFKEKYRSEKLFLKSTNHKTFLKTRQQETKDDSSPPSSDEHEWAHGGEAMADEISFSITSSSDESKDNNNKEQQIDINTKLQSIINLPITKSDINNVKSILLTIEDPKFAAVAAASTTTTLLEDETSPDSLVSYSESDILKTKERSNSSSKDINEKATPPTPGTPTNASNSLSLSDAKDDFLIDDEIADQPSLVFEDNINDFSTNTSENHTIVDSTPKPKRRLLQSIEGSPLLRNKKLLNSRTVSLDTLSPCESIASDDLMMDFDYSQSSGLDDVERVEKQNNSGFLSLDETLLVNKNDNNKSEDLGVRDWSGLLINKNKSVPKTPRLLRSRTGTPQSVPDSPRSFDSKLTSSTTKKPSPSLRLSRTGLLSNGAGYDSDDSIKLDRANHTAMKQDIMSIKTMLLKLRRVLNEQPGEDFLLRSETHIPFDGQITLANGFFNGCSDESLTTTTSTTTTTTAISAPLTTLNCDESKLELAELRRQVLFLQGQLEDKEKTVQTLQEQMIKLTTENYISNSAPASTIASTMESTVCNAATQTERIRPISAGPSLLNGSSVEGNAGSLVSVSKSSSPSSWSSSSSSVRKCDLNQTNESPSSVRRTQQSRLWRKPGEPPSPQRYTNNNNSLSSSPSLLSSIPRRANSRTRLPSTPS